MSSHYLIRLVDEQGCILAEMQDERGVVDDVLVPSGEACRGLARHIDPYGRTSFNGAQCEALLEEFGFLDIDKPHNDFMARLRTLLRRAVDEVHLHLIFLGD